MPRILIVDDELSIRKSLSILLGKEGYRIDEVSNGKEAIEKINAETYDMVITDLKMEPVDGIDVLKKSKALSQATEVMVMTGYGTIESGVEAMKLGAYDYITKPFQNDDIIQKVNRALERKELSDKVKLLESQLREKYKFENIISSTNQMIEVLKMVSKVSKTDSTVLITGESGTGKELVARAIHNNSPRKYKAFVPINCGALPHDLQESELFGHVKGSFTGASYDKKGLLEEADGGTIFLDEIGEATSQVQVKLLRFSQDREIRRVGDNKPTYTDVRLIAATNKNLEQAIENNKFREDLYYRLNVIPIHLPPLRERKDDIPLLAKHFFKKHTGRLKIDIESISKRALSLFMSYDWPGNVRELENVIERSIILASGETITPEDLPQTLGGGVQMESKRRHRSGKTLSDVERLHILDTLEECSWNRKKSSERLDISTTTLWRKLKEYNISLKESPQDLYDNTEGEKS